MVLITASLLFALVVAVTCNGPCPSGCSCVGDRVSCVKLSGFPQPFTTDARHVEITSADIQEIPANAFKGAPHAELISFIACRIDTINSSAFNGNKAAIQFKGSSIHIIEGNAFTNVHATGSKEFIISYSTIASIKPFAFNNIQGFAKFTLDKTSVQTMNTNAFHQFSDIDELRIQYTSFSIMRSNSMSGFTNIRAMDILNSSVLNLEPNTLDRLQADLGDSLTISFLDVDCNCGVAWLYDASARSSSFNLDGIVCFLPLKFHNVFLKTLAQSNICSTPNLDPSTVFNSRENSAAFLKISKVIVLAGILFVSGGTVCY